MQIIRTLEALRDWRLSHHHHAVALVPTMGALHSGHMALVDDAKSAADVVIVTIFVNPTQFGPNEDFAHYPRTFDADCQLCEQHGVSALYAPDAGFLFPHGLQTAVVPPDWLANSFCGTFRPGHFTGVATVVLKLFMLVQPMIAVFGEKDAQQVAVIRQMVRDFHLPIQMRSVVTQREGDGLAISSRNRYLTTPSSRAAARLLYHTLTSLHSLFLEMMTEQQATHSPENSVEVVSLPLDDMLAIRDMITTEAQKNLPDTRITWEYLTPVNVDDFKPVDTITNGTLLLAALRIEEPDHQISVRLIDNWLIA